MKRKNMMKQAAVVALAVFGLMNCGGRPSVSAGEADQTPALSREEMATEWLHNVLMSAEGHMMPADSLAGLHESGSIRNVALPLNDEDVLPRMGTYRNDATGGTITFRPYTNEKDTVNPICQADFRVAMHSWEEQVYLPEDSAYTECIQNRGKGILAIYRIVHNYGPNGGKHRCYDKHPDGYPEYWGALLYVYPSADSLMMTVGYEESKRTYHYQKAE